MKFSVVFFLASTAVALPAMSTPPRAAAAGAITAAIIPDFGVTPGVQSTAQPGSCVGAGGKNIPCTCPPTKDAFVTTLNTFVSRAKAGNTPIAFSTDFSDQSVKTNLARINAMVNTMQNLNFDKTGRTGDGCPAVSFPTLANIQKQLQSGQNVTIGK